MSSVRFSFDFRIYIDSSTWVINYYFSWVILWLSSCNSRKGFVRYEKWEYHRENATLLYIYMYIGLSTISMAFRRIRYHCGRCVDKLPFVEKKRKKKKDWSGKDSRMMTCLFGLFCIGEKKQKMYSKWSTIHVQCTYVPYLRHSSISYCAYLYFVMMTLFDWSLNSLCIHSLPLPRFTLRDICLP